MGQTRTQAQARVKSRYMHINTTHTFVVGSVEVSASAACPEGAAWPVISCHVLVGGRGPAYFAGLSIFSSAPRKGMPLRLSPALPVVGRGGE